MRPIELACAAVISLLAATLWPGAAAANQIDGIWINPRGTVAVQAGPCGKTLCGRVVWASPEAMADARDSGVSKLIGTELLQDYRPNGRGSWSGRVFVPDMGRSFASTLRQLDANSLKIQGCLIGGFLCKSQIWHRR